jgi:hypothetical protein
VASSAPRALLALALGLALGLALAAPAKAKRRFVPGQHKTLQAAIDAASPGDTIWVAAGIYRGPFTLKKPLVLFGDGGRDSTILDGGDSARVLSVEGVKSGSIIGFGIRRGRATSGGGIYLVRDTTFAIRDCDFHANWEAAVGVWQSSAISIIGCRFRENRGSGLNLQSSTGLLLSCEFTGNSGHDGGAIALRQSRMLFPVRETIFERNRAEGSTGGAVNAADSSEIILASCTFRENTSAVAGGAVASMTGSRVSLSRCRFERNRAGSGGAAHSDHSGMNVAYCIFERNASTAAGSAIGVLGREMPNVNPIHANNTFFKNAAERDGATIFCLDVSPEIRKNVFVVDGDQRAVWGVRSSPLFDCNLIHDSTGGSIGTLPSASTLVGDPLFCDPEKGNFYVKDLSPALRAVCGPIGALGKGPDCSVFRLQPAR